MTLEQRFWSKVDRSSGAGCWLWISARDKKGRGEFSFCGRPILSHRFAYILTVGEIPKGLLVCHRCDNPQCVRPDHLFLGTHKDNTQDMVKKGRARGARGEAHRANKFSPETILAIYRAVGSSAEIGHVFGVSACHVANIKAGRKWKHLTAQAS